MRALRFQTLDDLEQMADGSRQTIQAHDDEDIASADLAHQPGKFWPCARGAGAVLLKNLRAAGGAQLVGLGVGRLILGRDAGVAQKAARRPVGGDGSFVTFLWSAPLRSPIRWLMLAAFNRSWRLASRD